MKCPECSAEITFWMALKQPTPFRFKCSKCKAKYAVSTPRMVSITIGIAAIFIVLTVGLLEGTDEFGAIFFVPFFLLMLGLWLALEVWLQKYISKFGTLTMVGSTKQNGDTEDENGQS